MRSPCLEQAAPPKWRGAAVVTSLLVLGLAACSGAAAQVRLPSKPPLARQAAAASPVVLTPRQQVVAALTGYTSALAQADRSRSPARARQLLRPYLAASRIGGLVQAMTGIWARGETFYGQDELHVSSVTVDRRRAFVHDCDNTSGMGLQNTTTGQQVPGSAGIPRDNLVTRLDLVGGRWVVEFQLVEDVACTP